MLLAKIFTTFGIFLHFNDAQKFLNQFFFVVINYFWSDFLKFFVGKNTPKMNFRITAENDWVAPNTIFMLPIPAIQNPLDPSPLSRARLKVVKSQNFSLPRFMPN